MQEPRESQQIVKLVVGEAFQGKWLVKNVRLVSHRWEDSATPDETGAQLAAIKAHLLDHQMYLLYRGGASRYAGLDVQPGHRAGERGSAR